MGSLHARHLMRPSLDDKCEEEELIENLSQIISKLISSTHRHIQCIRSSLGQGIPTMPNALLEFSLKSSGNIIHSLLSTPPGNKLEQRLTKNVVTNLLLALQDVTYRFRSSQTIYLKKLNSREARSNAFFEAPDFTTIDLSDSGTNFGNNAVDTFDNFLKPNASHAIAAHTDYFEQSDEQIDEFFQKSISQSGRMTQQQLLLFEEENTKMAEHREKEVIKIVQSIADLHDIFKDLGQMVQEQGTVLDRIDFNVEQTQVRVTEGYKQLQKAEMYQRKNRKMYCIVVLASVTLFMMILLILTKF